MKTRHQKAETFRRVYTLNFKMYKIWSLSHFKTKDEAGENFFDNI